MGNYLNPGNENFRKIVDTKYIDKTGLIELLNARIGTTKSLVCISRPRRFGKSFAAKMLCAYYDHSCDSHELFDRYQISGAVDYEKHMNQYHVINLDMSAIVSEAVKNKAQISDIPMQLSESIRQELVAFCPQISKQDNMLDCFRECVEITGREFVFVIDEWDAVI